MELDEMYPEATHQQGWTRVVDQSNIELDLYYDYDGDEVHIRWAKIWSVQLHLGGATPPMELLPLISKEQYDALMEKLPIY